METTQTIKIHFVGSDWIGRCVFKSENGSFYKTTQLEPYCGFETLQEEDKLDFLNNLYTTSEFDGEPGFPCSDKFILEA